MNALTFFPKYDETGASQKHRVVGEYVSYSHAERCDHCKAHIEPGAIGYYVAVADASGGVDQENWCGECVRKEEGGK